MKTSVKAFAILGIALSGLAATPSQAHERHGRYYGDRYGYENSGYYGDSYDRRGYYDDDYYRRAQAQRSYNDGYAYSGCRRSSGTTGTIIGAVAGGLLGREIGRGRYGRPSGTGGIIGAGLGALAGRSIERSGCR